MGIYGVHELSFRHLLENFERYILKKLEFKRSWGIPFPRPDRVYEYLEHKIYKIVLIRKIFHNIES